MFAPLYRNQSMGLISARLSHLVPAATGTAADMRAVRSCAAASCVVLSLQASREPSGSGTSLSWVCTLPTVSPREDSLPEQRLPRNTAQGIQGRLCLRGSGFCRTFLGGRTAVVGPSVRLLFVLVIITLNIQRMPIPTGVQGPVLGFEWGFGLRLVGMCTHPKLAEARSPKVRLDGKRTDDWAASLCTTE